MGVSGWSLFGRIKGRSRFTCLLLCVFDFSEFMRRVCWLMGPSGLHCNRNGVRLSRFAPLNPLSEYFNPPPPSPPSLSLNKHSKGAGRHLASYPLEGALKSDLKPRNLIGA